MLHVERFNTANYKHELTKDVTFLRSVYVSLMGPIYVSYNETLPRYEWCVPYTRYQNSAPLLRVVQKNATLTHDVLRLARL